MATAGMTAATAQAAPTIGIAPVKSCYLSGETVNFLGGGYTPGAYVDISIDGESLGQLLVNPSGAIGGSIAFGSLKGAKAHTVTATDTTNPALTVSLSFNGTTRQVTVKPQHARAGKKLKIRGYGFLSGPNAYMHVRGHGYRADTRVGKPEAPCGTFAAKRRIVPRTASSGRYSVQFDHKKRYSKKTQPRVRGTMTVSRTFSSTAFGGASPLYGWTQVG